MTAITPGMSDYHTLSDPELYSRDAGAFHAMTKRLVLARDELNNAEIRWLELEEMRAETATGN